MNQCQGLGIGLTLRSGHTCCAAARYASQLLVAGAREQKRCGEHGITPPPPPPPTPPPQDEDEDEDDEEEDEDAGPPPPAESDGSPMRTRSRSAFQYADL